MNRPDESRQHLGRRSQEKANPRRPRKLLALAASILLSPSCAIYDGGGGAGTELRVGESAEIVERKVTLLSLGENTAKVRIGSSWRTRELTEGRYEPMDFSRGLVLVEIDGKRQTARINGFHITRTLNPYQPF